MFVIDHTAWGRTDAKTLKDRTYQYQKQSTVVAGQGYSTIAWLPDSGGSWALPITHERIISWESPISKAVWQIKQVVKHLQHRAVVLLDREYGNAKWVLETSDLEIECVMRIRSNTCLWNAPPAYGGLVWTGSQTLSLEEIWHQYIRRFRIEHVQQSMFSLLLKIGTPALPPKSRGKSPGRTIWFKCTPRICYPIAKKGVSRPKSKPKTG